MHMYVIPVFTFCLLYNILFNLCGCKSPEIPFLFIQGAYNKAEPIRKQSMEKSQRFVN